MFRRAASISFVVLALCVSTASAGFDWTAVTNKGSMQTGEVSLFGLCRVLRERVEKVSHQRFLISRRFFRPNGKKSDSRGAYDALVRACDSHRWCTSSLTSFAL